MQLVANQRTDNDAFSMLDESDRAQNVAALAFGASQLKKIENKWCSLCRTKLTGKFLIFRHAGQSFDFSFTDENVENGKMILTCQHCQPAVKLPYVEIDSYGSVPSTPEEFLFCKCGPHQVLRMLQPKEVAFQSEVLTSILQQRHGMNVVSFPNVTHTSFNRRHEDAKKAFFTTVPGTCWACNKVLKGTKDILPRFPNVIASG